MNENEHEQHQNEKQKHNNGHYEHRPYWKGAHRDWRVWVGVILMLAAILYYIMSDNFIFAPHKQLKQPSENNRTP
jgi:hypothetical protein